MRGSRAVTPGLAGLMAIAGSSCTPDTPDPREATPESAEPTVVADGLDGPMGILVEDDGTVWIVDSGVGGDRVVQAPDPVARGMAEGSFGETSRVVRVSPSGERTEFARLPSLRVGGLAYGGARLALLDGALYATSGGWVEGSPELEPDHSGVVRVDPGRVTEVVNTRELEVERNPDGGGPETNPFGLTAGPDGALWMTDAAGNALYRVHPVERRLELVVAFDVLPGEAPNPARGGALEVEAVPTGIAFMGGEAYVSLLPGLPMSPGSARVVHVSATGEVRDYAIGLTRLTDLQTGPDGRLYAVSMGIPTADDPTGSVVRIGPGASSEAVVTGLPFPTGLAFDRTGALYVTTHGVGEPGSGQVLRYPAIARPLAGDGR